MFQEIHEQIFSTPKESCLQGIAVLGEIIFQPPFPSATILKLVLGPLGSLCVEMPKSYLYLPSQHIHISHSHFVRGNFKNTLEMIN